MKIALAVDRLLNGQGISRVVINISEYLFNKGYDVRIITGLSDIVTVVPVDCVPYSEFLKNSSIGGIKKRIRAFEPDIFHSHFFPMDLVGAMHREQRMRHVMHVHGTLPMMYRNGLIRKSAFLRSSLCEAIGIHNSDYVIPVSNFIVNELDTKYRKKKLRRIYNSVDLELFNTTNYNPNQIAIDESKNTIFTVCPPTHSKGFDLLLNLARLIKLKSEEPFKIYVAGTQPLKNDEFDRVKTVIDNLGIKNELVLLGDIPHNKMPLYYSATSIFLCVSRWESFCLPIAEAFSCWKPVIAFNHSVIPEFVLHGYNGLLINPYNLNSMSDEIINLFHDDVARKRMGRNARQFAEINFSINKNGSEIENVYNEVLGN